MRISAIILALAMLMYSCSSSEQKKTDPSELLDQLENVPFEKLKTVRVMLSIASDKVDQQQLRQSIIEEFGKIGVVHDPKDTSMEQLLEAQKKPFALMTIDVSELATSNYEKRFPVMSLSCRMYEGTELDLNKKPWMSNVWEKISYLDLQEDQNAISQEMEREIRNLAKEFSESFYKVNPKSSLPEFFIGKNIK